MRKRTPIKDQQAESALFLRRALLSLALILLVFGVLLGRFFELMVLRHDEYAARSERNRVKLQPLPPARGLILDRHGEILADNRLAYRLEVVPERTADLAATLDELAQVIAFDADERSRFLELVAARRRFQSLPLKLRLSEAEVARFALERYRFPGVDVVPYLTRHYPQGELFAHVVGYVGRIDPADLGGLDARRYAGTTHVGKTGIERTYEDALHGEVGYEKVETNAEGRVLRVLERTPPRAGEAVYLAIDAGLQRATAAAMAGQTGAAVAIDPASGEILAFVSLPSYDANLFVSGISRRDYQALLEAPGRPLFNRALQGGYEPGSTLKPFMALAGLELGVRSVDYTIVSTGEFRIPGQDIGFRDWRRGGHGRVDLVESLAQSVNSYYYQLALDLGIDRMHGYLSRFGFGAPTGVDLAGEAAGILPSREWKRARFNQPWYPGETVIAGIGQGYNVATLLQLASATAAIAAGGRRFRPRLAHALRASFDVPPRPLPPELLDPRLVRDPAHLALVQRGLVAVMHSPTGTARAVAAGAAYRIAGKTGTAQRVSRRRDTDAPQTLREGQRNQALFIGYAPAEAPTIAIAVVVEQGGSGSQAAAPVARRILDAWLGAGESGEGSADEGGRQEDRSGTGDRGLGRIDSALRQPETIEGPGEMSGAAEHPANAPQPPVPSPAPAPTELPAPGPAPPMQTQAPRERMP
ncbi:MAG: penicillin-binding protein 2 [Xanthomonadales bacterium]|nr:penicillin-binding protein 2 [Xanthomonadales bacterium]MCE7931862.1 penicillin-binding protein 2 [Xanthomonadales bacterium PRO6]